MHGAPSTVLPCRWSGVRAYQVVGALLIVAVTTACSQKPRWHQVVSEAGGYAVVMPNDPRHSTQKADSSHGQLDAHFTIAVLGGTTYSIMHVDYPVAALTSNDEVLKMAVQGVFFNTGSKQKSIERITIDGHPGLAFTAENASGLPLWGRVYLVGRRLYQLTVSGLNKPTSKETAQRFLESFELKSRTMLETSPG